MSNYCVFHPNPFDNILLKVILESKIIFPRHITHFHSRTGFISLSIGLCNKSHQRRSSQEHK